MWQSWLLAERNWILSSSAGRDYQTGQTLPEQRNGELGVSAQEVDVPIYNQMMENKEELRLPSKVKEIKP